MFSLHTSEILMAQDSNAPFVLSRLTKQIDAIEGARLPMILVVDDERLVAETLTEILEDSGYSVMTAYDGWEALELANQHQPEFVLTDVLMPRMNGVELAIAIRKMWPATKILLFSGNAGVSEILDTGREQGFEFDTLGKPIHPSVLLQRLSELK